MYGDSVLGKYGQKPTVRDVVKVGTFLTDYYILVVVCILFSFFTEVFFCLIAYDPSKKVFYCLKRITIWPYLLW